MIPIMYDIPIKTHQKTDSPPNCTKTTTAKHQKKKHSYSSHPESKLRIKTFNNVTMQEARTMTAIHRELNHTPV
jgi:hypothetical protein